MKWVGLVLMFWMPVAEAQPTYATWYSTKESHGRMANGKVLDDHAYTAASWNYHLGQMVEVTNTKTGQVVRVRITDRGPAHQPSRQGVKIDLTRQAFQALAPLSQGKISVTIEAVN